MKSLYFPLMPNLLFPSMKILYLPLISRPVLPRSIPKLQSPSKTRLYFSRKFNDQVYILQQWPNLHSPSHRHSNKWPRINTPSMTKSILPIKSLLQWLHPIPTYVYSRVIDLIVCRMDTTYWRLLDLIIIPQPSGRPNTTPPPATRVDNICKLI